MDFYKYRNPSFYYERTILSDVLTNTSAAEIGITTIISKKWEKLWERKIIVIHRTNNLEKEDHENQRKDHEKPQKALVRPALHVCLDIRVDVSI